MSATGVYRDILRLYRFNFRFLLVLAVLVFIPVGLAKAVPVVIDVNEVGVVEGLALFAWFLAEVAIGFFGVIFYSGVTGGLVEAEELGQREPLLSLLRGIPYRRLTAIDILVTFGTLFGLVLLVIPGLLFLSYYALAAPLAEIEGLGVRAALRRSRALVRRRPWLVIRVVVPISIAAAALTSGAERLAGSALGEGIPAEWLATTVALIATTPFYALAVAVLMVELSRDEAGGRPL